MARLLAAVFLLFSLVAQSAMASSVDDDSHVVVRYVYNGGSKKRNPNCAQHEKKIAMNIHNAMTKQYKARRELMKYRNVNCTELCRNVAKGYCYLAYYGICDDRRRLGTTTTSKVMTLPQSRCSKKTTIVKDEIAKYGKSLKTNDKCRTYFLNPNNWKADCLYLN